MVISVWCLLLGVSAARKFANRVRLEMLAATNERLPPGKHVQASDTDLADVLEYTEE